MYVKVQNGNDSENPFSASKFAEIYDFEMKMAKHHFFGQKIFGTAY